MSTRVIHVGVVGDVPGGMAQVVNAYLEWDFPGFELEALASTRGRHDPLSPLRWARSALVLWARRIRHGRSTIAAFHLSERGSFLREGSLVLWSRLIGLHTTVHLHGAEFVEFARNRPSLVRTVLSRAEVVLVLTTATREAAANLLGPGSDTDVVQISNAVAVPEQVSTKEKIVLFGGEIGHRKGADILLEAWRGIDPRVRDGWRLRLVGPCRMTLSDADLPHDVDLERPVGRREMTGLQATSAIAVLPSRDEALPMFLVEAMSHACAVVATPVGEVATLLADGAGAIVPVGDVEALATALSHLMTHEQARSDSGAAARLRITERHDSARIARGLIDRWSQLLEGTR